MLHHVRPLRSEVKTRCYGGFGFLFCLALPRDASYPMTFVHLPQSLPCLPLFVHVTRWLMVVTMSRSSPRDDRPIIGILKLAGSSQTKRLRDPHHPISVASTLRGSFSSPASSSDTVRIIIYPLCDHLLSPDAFVTSVFRSLIDC